MAEGAVGTRKKCPGRGVMQVDRMLVGKNELHPAKSIFRARFLANSEREILARILRPVDRRKRDGLAPFQQFIVLPSAPGLACSLGRISLVAIE
jgi:hypothetical protein